MLLGASTPAKYKIGIAITIKRDRLISRYKIKNRNTMPKPDIHPTWYPEAKVICNGEVVMTVGSTQPEINVDVWSGNHPFYTGTQKIIDTEGRVDRFLRKYGMLDSNSDDDNK